MTAITGERIAAIVAPKASPLMGEVGGAGLSTAKWDALVHPAPDPSPSRGGVS